MKYMLDTNICIYTIKRKPSSVVERIRRTKLEEICLSTITLSELEYGVAKSSSPDRNRLALLAFLTPFRILDFDQAAAAEYGRIRSELERKGMVIGPMDLLIAAHTKSCNLILVSNNIGEFARIDGLKAENWV